jgi:hypothetical protein
MIIIHGMKPLPRLVEPALSERLHVMHSIAARGESVHERERLDRHTLRIGAADPPPTVPAPSALTLVAGALVAIGAARRRAGRLYDALASRITRSRPSP